MMQPVEVPRLPTQPLGVLELRAEITRWLADGRARRMMASAYGLDVAQHGLDALEIEARHMPSAAAVWANDEMCALVRHNAPLIPLDAHPPPMPLVHGLMVLATPLEVWPGRKDRMAGLYWREDVTFMLLTHVGHLDRLGTFSANVQVDSPVEDRDDWTSGTRVAWKTLAAVQTLLAQRLPVAPRLHADRAMRRRLQREHRGDEPLGLQVIDLRRPQRTSGPAGDGSVDWSHRWVVNGHPRQQWCPSRQRHELRIIEPFIKGPPDKPIVVNERLYRWSR